MGGNKGFRPWGVLGVEDDFDGVFEGVGEFDSFFLEAVVDAVPEFLVDFLVEGPAVGVAVHDIFAVFSDEFDECRDFPPWDAGFHNDGVAGRHLGGDGYLGDEEACFGFGFFVFLGLDFCCDAWEGFSYGVFRELVECSNNLLDVVFEFLPVAFGISFRHRCTWCRLG